MVTTKLNLSMTEPSVRQIYAKQGDTGRVLDITLDQTPENGTLRILRPDGVEVTADAVHDSSEEELSGDIVTFDAYDSVPLTKAEVTLEPIQDLNGYDNPWVGGAGKNLYNASALNILSGNGITATVSNGTITLNGTATANAFFNVFNTGYTNTQYTFSLNNPVVNSGVHMAFRTTSESYFADSPANTVNRVVTFTNEPDDLLLYVTSGTTLSNFVVKPQLELGSTATAWQPYSNICPITGHTEVEVYIGAEQGTADETYTTSLGRTVYGGTLDVVTGKLVVDKGYYKVTNVSEILGNGSQVGTYPKWVMAINSFPNVDPSYYGQFWDREDAVISNVGVMVRESISLNTNETTMSVYFHANSMEIRPRPLVSDFPTLEEAKQAYVGAEFVYPVIPTTYQLTPQQIQTLVGTNNIWSDSGTIEVAFAYDSCFAELPSEATEVVGKCYCDVEQNGVSSMPFTLNVKKNERAT